MRNGTWTLVPRPKNRNVISSKWVLTKKKDAHGVVMRCKARVVARGFSQIPGVYFKETFALLAGLKRKDKWGGRFGYSNKNIFIIRRDGSGTVVPIRIRTDSDAGCLSAPIVTLSDAYKRIR